MKQIFQSLKTGKTDLVEVPVPHLKSRYVLIQTKTSLISPGTERMLLAFGKASYISKAMSQPEKLHQVLDKIKTDGLVAAIKAVNSKLEQPQTLGYSSAGVVKEISDFGSQICDLKIGDRVVTNGPHAEFVCVPCNLCAQIPENVSNEEATFTVLGAIGLQGIRLAQPTLGECFVVIGLGLIGLLTVQILQANGCRVLGIDLDTRKCDLAKQFGANTLNLSKGEEPVQGAIAFSNGRGVDGVLITAATESSEPVHQAAQMCRKRGRIVLVGIAGLELNRSDFYEKEIFFQVSCSYGPGRYDPEYEERGHDYPIGYVRWTEKRNFRAVLDLMARGKINVRPLITHRFQFEQAGKGYELIERNKEPYIGILLTYGGAESSRQEAVSRTVRLPTSERTGSRISPGKPVIGFIGAGNFSGQVLLPALEKTGLRLKTIASAKGVTGTHLGKKFGFEESTTDAEKIFSDPEITTVFITTRHDSHARFVINSIKAGKHVFVEKPLCLNQTELEEIITIYNQINETNQKNQRNQILMVGFNRRFAPHIVKMKELLDAAKEPKSMVMTVNAGFLPSDHWTHDPQVGGGRIVGEACHFVDLMRYLVGNKIVSSEIARIKNSTNDTATITLGFSDGSVGTIHYFANGNRKFPKERVEVFCGQKVLQLDNFKVLKGYGWKQFKRIHLWSQDKGHNGEVKAFIDAIEKGLPSPIPFDEIAEVMRVTIELSGRHS